MGKPIYLKEERKADDRTAAGVLRQPDRLLSARNVRTLALCLGGSPPSLRLKRNPNGKSETPEKGSLRQAADRSALNTQINQSRDAGV